MQVSEKEQQYARKVNSMVASRTGNQTPNWAFFTYVMTVLQFIISMLVCLYKPDFLNFTVACLAIMLLHNIDQKQFHRFRILTGLLALSLGYDLLWFFMKAGEYNSSDDGDGGMEYNIRVFSFWMAVIAFFFKIVMVLVYWMASITFADVLDERTKLITKM